MLRRFRHVWSARLRQVGADPRDSGEVRSQKTLLATSALMVAPAGVIWGLIYLYFDEPLAAAIPLGYAVLSYASLGELRIHRPV